MQPIVTTDESPRGRTVSFLCRLRLTSDELRPQTAEASPLFRARSPMTRSLGTMAALLATAGITLAAQDHEQNFSRRCATRHPSEVERVRIDRHARQLLQLRADSGLPTRVS